MNTAVCLIKTNSSYTVFSFDLFISIENNRANLNRTHARISPDYNQFLLEMIHQVQVHANLANCFAGVRSS